jgi:hypothetical protein
MKKILFIGLLFMGISCVNKPTPPEGIMSQQEMVDFLIDLHIIEAKVSMSRIPNDSVKLFFDYVEVSLNLKHHLTDSIYKKSYQYYLENIDLMEEIYSAVVDSMSLRERILDTE